MVPLPGQPVVQGGHEVPPQPPQQSADGRRGEDDHVLPYNGDGHVPARDIKSSLRRHLEKRLKKLEEMGQQPAD